MFIYLLKMNLFLLFSLIKNHKNKSSYYISLTIIIIKKKSRNFGTTRLWGAGAVGRDQHEMRTRQRGKITWWWAIMRVVGVSTALLVSMLSFSFLFSLLFTIFIFIFQKPKREKEIRRKKAKNIRRPLRYRNITFQQTNGQARTDVFKFSNNYLSTACG